MVSPFITIESTVVVIDDSQTVSRIRMTSIKVRALSFQWKMSAGRETAQSSSMAVLTTTTRSAVESRRLVSQAPRQVTSSVRRAKRLYFGGPPVVLVGEYLRKYRSLGKHLS